MKIESTWALAFLLLPSFVVSQASFAVDTVECTQNFDCGALEVCLEGNCVNNSGAVEDVAVSQVSVAVDTECTKDSDCDGVAQICLADSCVASGVADVLEDDVGVAIAVEVEVVANLCQGNPCPEGQICNGRTGGCLEAYVFEVALESDLCQGNPCDEGYVCINGRCIKTVVLPPESIALISIDVCLVSCGRNEICLDGECVELLILDAEIAATVVTIDGCIGCTENEVCVSGLCITPISSQLRAVELTLFDPCTAQVCAGVAEICIDGVCQDSNPSVANLGGTCGLDTDCDGLQICVGGVCVDSGTTQTTAWYHDVKNNFVGERLKRCFKRGNTPPTDGTRCAATPKTCFFGDQSCGSFQYPATRCFCDGKGGTRTWSCGSVSCPSAANSPVL